MIEFADPVVVGGIIAAALAASTLSAVTGFGGAAIMLPVLVAAFGIRDAVPILTVVQLIGNGSRVWLNRSELHFNVVRWFAVGAVPAAIVGSVIFANAPAAVLVRVLGVFLLLTVAYRHTPVGSQTKIGLRGFLPVGGVAAFLSALTGVAGPFMAPFFLAYGLIKGAYIGTEAMATVVMHVTKLGIYGGYELLSAEILGLGAAIGGVMFVGSYLGKRLLDRVPESFFPYIVEAVMVLAGISFIVRG
jgi:uncharacterized membrane protein YfcA